jgi:hypothetical protein
VFSAAVLGFATLSAAQAKIAPSKTAKATNVDKAAIALTVQNLLGKYEFYHFANLYDDERYVDLFANDPDTKIATGRGIWQGPDAAKRITSWYSKHAGAEAYAGEMHLHPVSTPVIEVAGDGQTARGVWISDGVEAGVKDSAPNGMSLWLKYCVDFKNMNGDWKIWHLDSIPIFMQQYDKPWQSGGGPGGGAPAAGGAAPGGGGPPTDPAKDKFKADRPNINRTPYNTSMVQTLNPLPPLPYETWDNSMSCIK